MDLVLYGAPLSPFVRKVEVCLREKGLEFEQENVNIFPAPDWFAEISPAKRIPVLRDRAVAEDATLPDSSVICAYLERRQPEPALYPANDFDHGRALWFEEYADTEVAQRVGMGVFRKTVVARFMNREPDLEAVRKTCSEQLPPLFDYLETEIAGRDFFVGESFTIADVAVATQLLNLELAVGTPDTSRWPELIGHMQRMAARPSFAPNLEACHKLVPAPLQL